MSDRKKNLIQYSEKWTPELAREYGRKGGKASGESRRRKLAFRDAFNTLLTSEIDSPEWKEKLESMGLDCTLEAAIAMAMAKEAYSGNVKAFEAIARYTGQSDKTELDELEQEIRIRRSQEALDREINQADLQKELERARAELAQAQAELARAKASQLYNDSDEEGENPFQGLTTEELRRLIDDE